MCQSPRVLLGVILLVAELHAGRRSKYVHSVIVPEPCGETWDHDSLTVEAPVCSMST